MKRTARIIVRVAGWILLSIIGLFLLTYLLIQTPPGQNFARKRIVAYLENKLHTNVEIGKLSISFPRRVILENVYFEDQKKDTLLAGKKMRVDIELFKLLSNEVIIKHIGLEGIRANVYRLDPDSTFNFDYIVKAFTPANTKGNTDTSQMKIELNTIDLKDVVATFHDDRTGNDMYVNVGSLQSRIDTFNPAKLIYSIPQISASNITANIRQYKPLLKEEPMAVIEAESNQPTAVQVRLKDVDLSSIKFKYDNTVSSIKTDVQLGRLAADVNDMNLATLNVDMEKLELDSTKAVIWFGRNAEAAKVTREVAKEVEAQVNNPWKFQLASLSMNDNDIKYDNDNLPRTGRGLDYAHFDAKDITVEASDIALAPDRSEASIQQIALTEKSGLVLKEARADLVFTDEEIILDPLFIRTNRTVLRDRVHLTYPSLANIARDPGSLVIDANIENSTIAVRDILIFAPALANVSPFSHHPNDIFFLDADVNGPIRDLRIPHFVFRGFNNTSVNATAHIKGLPNPNSTYYDINILNIRTNKKDVLSLLPEKAIPNTIRLPETYNGSAAFRGTITAYNIKADLNTDRGSIDMIGFVSNNGNTYTARGSVAGLDVGYIFKQKDIGKVSAYLNIRGNGMDPRTAVISGEANIRSAYYNGYTYKNIVVDGELRRGIVNATAKGTDPNAAFDLVINADLNSTTPSFRLKGSLQNVNFTALNLTKQPLSIKANVDADLLNADPDNLRGTITVKDIVLTMNGQQYRADSIFVRADGSNGNNSLTVNSEALSLQLQGQYKLTEIATALQTTIDRYYNIPGFVPTDFTPQNWTITATLYESPLLYQFAPQIKGSDSILVNASFNSLVHDLKADVKASTFMFNGNAIDSLNLNVNTTPDRLNYNVSALRAGTKTFAIDRTYINGFVANDQVTLAADVKDNKGVSKYQLAGTVQQIPGGVEFSLRQGSVMFNYEQWVVGTNNFIRYTDQGLLINNFTISKDDQSLSLQSDPLQINAPVLARFSNFRISTITRIAQQQNLLIDGTVNGTAVLRDVMSDNPVFTSDLMINDLVYKGDSLGNASVKVNNQTANSLVADIRLLGKNDVRISGRYIISEKSMDLTADIVRLDLKTVLPFTEGQVRDAGGYLKGTASIKGTFENPIINGDIGFDSAYIALTILGERLTLPTQNIKVTERGFRLNNYTLTDSLGNKAIIDGEIIAKNGFTDMSYNMYVSMEDFRLINTNKRINQLYYGLLNVDSELEIWGSLESPNVDGYVRVNPTTDFGFILPGNNPELISREGVVRFVDVDQGDTTFLAPLDTALARTGLTGLSLYVDVSTDTAAQLALVIDERNGDILKFRGDGDLAMAVDRSGKISMTGTYELVGGSYVLNFNMLRREFDIMSGSSVTWTGEPTEALVNITAQYIANTPSIDLVEPQLVGRSPAEINRYKQRLPFILTLRMTGELMKPVLLFDIALPENEAAQWTDVDDKLEELRRDEAEMNKQVFALLLLNRFVQENPFQSSASASNPVSSFARQSVSRLLTEQLNNLAGNLISGVDLNFGVVSQEDFTTGVRQNRTDLTINASKRLLNDRLTVSVGSNFELEGPQNRNASSANLLGNVAVDYRVSRDGRYLLRAYRRNDYDFIVEGQVIETGVAFIFALDFETMRDLFRRKVDPANTQRIRKQVQ